MKFTYTISLLFATLLFCSCSGTKFSYLKDADIEDYGLLKTFKIDNSYTLYVRQIIRLYDSASKTFRPSNAITVAGNNIIEIEYMLLSKDKQQVIILNNIPSIYQKIVGPEKKRSFNLAGKPDDIEIDIWYFRQFRFGKVTGDKFIFSNADGSTLNHIWNITESNDSINVLSISIADKYGEETRNTKEAFALGIVFRKVNSFKILFKYKAGNEKTNNFDLKDQTLYLSSPNNKYRVIFKFNESVTGTDNKNIGFTKDRLYAEPVE